MTSRLGKGINLREGVFIVLDGPSVARVNHLDTEDIVQDGQTILRQAFVPAKAVQIARAVMPAQNEITADEFLCFFVIERNGIRRVAGRSNRLPVGKPDPAQQDALRVDIGYPVRVWNAPVVAEYGQGNAGKGFKGDMRQVSDAPVILPDRGDKAVKPVLHGREAFLPLDVSFRAKMKQNLRLRRASLQQGPDPADVIDVKVRSEDKPDVLKRPLHNPGAVCFDVPGGADAAHIDGHEALIFLDQVGPGNAAFGYGVNHKIASKSLNF